MAEQNQAKFDTIFRALSYAAVFCGFLSLWISGTFGILGTALFVAMMLTAWFIEGTRLQINERLGTLLIVAAMPVFFVLWRIRFFSFVSTETELPGLLARLILSLTAIKLLQKKSDRDWIFLYVMAFFEVLLAAGLSISALYLVSFISYTFVMVCTIVLFEMRKTDRTISENRLVRHDTNGASRIGAFSMRRLPFASVVLIIGIVMIAAPMFFLLPRVGGAGIGGGQGGIATSSGFSDTVRLGGIGRIQENDEVVMRVRLDEGDPPTGGIRWRGIALDVFDNQAWRRSKAAFREVREKGERDVIQVDSLTDREDLSLQTFYLEPLDAPVLFVLPRAVGIQGNFPVLFKDAHDGLSFQRSGERISYKVLSDTRQPPTDVLRGDREPYRLEERNYLQLPRDLDGRIAVLAAQLVAGADNRYDAAAMIESHLRSEFGYTLEQKAGGSQPLADFLFNIREGHCEYFATAMAIMLRTQGIATRVVNGFQQGEYNETADIYVVRQREAHSWVEVYFPGADSWVAFDPTPSAGRSETGPTGGFTAKIGKYLEALEMIWIQYFVAFDNQEQRTLFTSIRRGVSDYNAKASSWISEVQDAVAAWWSEVRGDSGTAASLIAMIYGIAAVAGAALLIFLFVRLYRKIVKLKVWGKLWNRLYGKRGGSAVEFYERFLGIFAENGVVREPFQTPMEFAHVVGIPEAVKITERYNRVRFGEQQLSPAETEEVERWLEAIAETSKNRSLVSES